MDIYLSSSLSKNLKKVIDYANSLNLNLEISRFGDIATLDSEFESLLKYFSSNLKELHGKISLHGFFVDLNPASTEPRIKEATIHRYNQSFEIAKTINANTVVFHSGYNGLVKHPVYHELFINNQIEFWSKFIKKFEDHGITAVLENTYENEPEILLTIVEHVNSENLKICIDTGHVNINSSYSTTEWIKKVGNRLHHMHLHNNFAKSDEHNSVLKGTIDFNSVIKTVKDLNLKPNMVLEIFNLNEAKESLEFVKEHLSKEIKL